MIHPEDYQELVYKLRKILEDCSTDIQVYNQTTDRGIQDFTFPACRVKKTTHSDTPSYENVFLTGYIRQTIWTGREKSRRNNQQIVSVSNASWPRLAMFFRMTSWQYMTLHDFHGNIIQADPR